jgi:hypothetical protein
MDGNTRRGFLTALLGMSVLGARPFEAPAKAAADSPLPLPDRPLHLTRLLQRGLDESGLAAIAVRRWWEIGFERQGRGIVVSGRQVGAEVSAPPALAEIARIEQARDGSDLFPLMLSDRGVILSTPSPSDADAAVSEALRAAERLIARQRLAATDKARLRHYLSALQRAGAGLLDALPGDLLFPDSAPVEYSETVALPEGLTGRLTLSYRAQPQPDMPWLAQAERRVTTVIGSSEQRAAETWTLGPPEPWGIILP